MRERPILFKGPLVRAILEGRKTVTRRIINPQPIRVEESQSCMELPNGRQLLFGPGWWHRECSVADSAGSTFAHSLSKHCPHGQPGDRLYVRESFRFPGNLDHHSPAEAARRCLEAYPEPWCPTRFEADQTTVHADVMRMGTTWGSWGKLRPSIHMPRWASRIDLEIVSVRAERLDDITDEDAIAEGITRSPNGHPEHIRFAELWDSINAKRGPEGDPGAYSWDRNPWIWRIEFRRLD